MMKKMHSDHNGASATGQGRREANTRVPMISYSIRTALLATAFAVSAFASTPSADAASFDGPWSVLVITKSGGCDQSYRYGLMIRGSSVSYLGGGAVSVSGRLAPNGHVNVNVSAAGQSAAGVGRLSGGRGSGTWRGQGASGTCAGVWSATQG
jgi:hypothetical protein